MNHGFYVSKKVKKVSGLLSLLYHSDHSISKHDRLKVGFGLLDEHGNLMRYQALQVDTFSPDLC